MWRRTGYNTAVITSFLILFFLLSFLSAFFSSAEIAYIAANKHNLEAEAAKQNRGAAWALLLLKSHTKFFSLVLLGNNLVNVALSAIVTIFAVHFYGEENVYLAALLLTLFILIFCETLPKSIAVRNSQSMVLMFSYILYPLYIVFNPIIAIINKFVSLIQAIFVKKPSDETEDEARTRNLERLKGAIVDSRSALAESHTDMLLGILDLDKIKAEDAMTPLGKVFGINVDDDDKDILAAIKASDNSHLVVYKENMNNCLGFISVNGALLLDKLGGFNKEKLLESLKESEFIPGNVFLLNLVDELMAGNNHRAFVVDEYGTVQGIITLHDVMNEIMGSLNSLLMTEPSPGCYRFSTSASLREINNRLSWHLEVAEPQNKVYTLRGLIQEQLESLPEGPVSLEIDGYRLETERPLHGVVYYAKIWEHKNK